MFIRQIRGLLIRIVLSYVPFFKTSRFPSSRLKFVPAITFLPSSVVTQSTTCGALVRRKMLSSCSSGLPSLREKTQT